MMKYFCGVLLTLGMLGCAKPESPSWNALTNPTNNSMLTCPVVNISVTSGTYCMNVTAIAIRNGKIIAYWQNGWKTADGNPLKDPQ